MFGFGEGTLTCTVNNTEPLPFVFKELLTRLKRDSILISCIQPVIASLGVFMNLLFIVLVWKQNNLHSVTNTYLVHLAIADSVFVFFKTVVNLISFFKSPMALNYVFLGRAGCIMDAFVPFSCYYASLMIVTIVTLERYIAICYPFKHRRMNGKSRTRKLLTACWITAALFGLAQAFETMDFLSFCIQFTGGNEDNVLYKYGNCQPLNRDITNISSFILEFGTFFIAMIGKHCSIKHICLFIVFY